MLDVLRAIETLPPVEALKASFVVYPLLSAVHVMAIGSVFTTVALMDLAILGVARLVDPVRLRPVAVAAFAVAALTGLLLFSVNASEYAFNWAFRAKLALITAAGLNLIAYDRFPDARWVTAALSLILWTGAVIAGRFIGFL